MGEAIFYLDDMRFCPEDIAMILQIPESDVLIQLTL